ncbi:MAG: hypothetical protein EOP09_07985 [Proteobacteria bacterium]|nr:MAG: hypothetical protein EOP09_07985 [Pseudomonadota bacterium]
MDPLPNLEKFEAIELDVTFEALQSARKTLVTMLSETRGRTALLEELLASDKLQKMRKILEKMRAIDETLQTRLLGLDAYVEQFRLAGLPGEDLLSTTAIVIGQSTRLNKLSHDNAALQLQADQMKRWLNERKLSLARLPFTPPPSPNAMQEVSLSMSIDLLASTSSSRII